MRQKRVFASRNEVARLWVNQSQESARYKGGNFYFNGETIFSYGSHFPIARITHNNAGERAILFTDRRYSNTTSRHIRDVWRAVRDENVIEVYEPDANQYENFSYWHSEAVFQVEKLARSRKPELYTNNIAGIKYKSEKYASFFGYELPANLVSVLSVTNKNEAIAFMVAEKMMK